MAQPSQRPQQPGSGDPRHRRARELHYQSRRLRYSKKRKKTVLLLGLIQMALGLMIIGVSFSVFALTSASRIRHASPCWAGFALLFTGGVGVIAWRQPSSLSLGFYTVLSCLCILLHLVATTLAGLGGMELQSIESCRTASSPDEGCLCCTSRDDCTGGANLLMYSGTTNCYMLQQSTLRDIMFANCMTNIIAIVLCIATSSVGFILALKRRRTQRIISRGYSNGISGYLNAGGYLSQIPTGDAHDQFPPIAFHPPPYAPPQYTEISNDPVVMPPSEEYREESAAPNVAIDPRELPPPYSTLDYGQRNGRRSRRTRGSSSSSVLENPHSEGHRPLSSSPPPSHISRGCSTGETPPTPPVRWDSHGLDVRPFILENQTVAATIAMGRGLVTEFPGHESESPPPPRSARSPRGSNPELSITENPLLPLSEAKTPLQIHMATRCEDLTMYMRNLTHVQPQEGSKRGGSLTHEPAAKREETPSRSLSERGRRHSHTGSKAATDRNSKKEAAAGKVKRRKSRRTRSLKSGAATGEITTRRYSSSSDSDEERMRASCPRRKPQKTSSLNSEGNSPKESSDCRGPSTSDQSTLGNPRKTQRSKSNSDATTSRDSVFNGFLCPPPRLASSERLTDVSSLEERLMAVRQSYESLTYSSNQGTLVDASPLRPTTLELRSGVAAPGTPSPTEFSNPWVPRSRSNTSEGVSFASSSLTLASEASGISSEVKHHSSHSDIAPKQDICTTTSMQKTMLPPLPVGYGQEKTPLILTDNDNQLPLKKPLTEANSLPIKERLDNADNITGTLQSKCNNLNNVNNTNSRNSLTKTQRPKSVVEVNHETRVGLKQLLMDIEEDVELPIKALLSDIQGMLKTDEHCLVDLQHSANIVRHFLDDKETNRITRSLEKLPQKDRQNDVVIRGLELAKETVL